MSTLDKLNIFKKIFGSRNDRLLREYGRLVKKINQLEPDMQALDDQALRAKTEEFKSRLEAGETLDDLLVEAFAVVREASVRTLGLRHFDVQLIGGITLHRGQIAEMRTGEGKTLMSTLPIYLNALTGRGVHVVTVNDYLARRDAKTNGDLFNFLGMTVGVVVAHQDNDEKLSAYKADVTYGTNNEFGFDYLRDNMEYRLEDKRQRSLVYAIVDEVDSILIDEARTPLIISGMADNKTDLYIKMDSVPAQLHPMAEEPKPNEPEAEGDYWVDFKAGQVYLSEEGHENAEAILTKMGLLPEGESLYEAKNIRLMHHLMLALRAHLLFFKDQHYAIVDGEIMIVDEFTGRFMKGRRWSDGLHQAIEAKERVDIQSENQTLASITFQNYFRMYEKLSGMTGTADTEAYELMNIYNLETVIIPTNLPMIRDDELDLIYLSAEDKYDAIIADIRDSHERGQPVLVGTTSIETSELLSNKLKKAKLPHEVLNAKQHEREAHIVTQAGLPGQITIATNMAGRGTDIVLGGNISPEVQAIQMDQSLSEEEKTQKIEVLRNTWKERNQTVKEAGGLRIIGTERHESRRVDNQLRGRSGRQGDPGASRFYLSLDDQLLRIFGGDRIRGMMTKLGRPGEAIESSMVSRSIESAQRKVEGHNFDIRKQLLEYDNVANDQRKVYYGRRNEILDGTHIEDIVLEMIEDAMTDLVHTFVPEDSMEEQWDIKALDSSLVSWGLSLNLADMVEKDESLTSEDILDRVIKAAKDLYHYKISLTGEEQWRSFESSVLLQMFDVSWREHLSALDHLRQGIHLRGYAQKDPKQEYQREAFELFSYMISHTRDTAIRILLTVEIRPPAQETTAPFVTKAPVVADHKTPLDMPEEELRRLRRNDPCPCGSGKKYKQCHGKVK